MGKEQLAADGCWKRQRWFFTGVVAVGCTCPSGGLHTHGCVRGRTWTQWVIKKKHEVLHERLELGVKLGGVRDRNEWLI